LKVLVDADAWQILGRNEILYFLPPTPLFKKRSRATELYCKLLKSAIIFFLFHFCKQIFTFKEDRLGHSFST